MTHFNQLTPAQAEVLALLAEEAGELIQAIGKILRHGLESTHPANPGGPTNADALVRELGDVQAAARLCHWQGMANELRVIGACNEKLERVSNYLHHATVPRI